MPGKLGKKPARPEAVKLKLSDILDATSLPVPPAAFGHQRMIGAHSWSMLGNDNYGDCVWAGAAHEHMLFSREGGHGGLIFDDNAVLSDYSACTGFNPDDPNSDQGTDMQQAASYRRKIGIVDKAGKRYKIDAYAAITRADLAQVALATWLFGATGIGVQFPDSAMDQFDHGKTFTIVPGARIEGGHYMPCIGRHRNGDYILVTWGRTTLATTAWMRQYMDEALAYVSVDVLNKNKQVTREGFDLPKLTEFLKSLGG